ncbi:hypothetical protein B6U49_09390 [Ligilactobacillus salivarius]|uniref:SH3 domain-containing protein n=2 Tax=Ligilactobacillus salivarius TaxID=1624 RepID=UPI0009D9A19A|nr:SH3 domain-containing protein [Ligilactobacillus salivarius]ATP36475.1 hypothetical protein CR249_09450 [Ligilactobacillus salivarius]OQR01488.1 hypothetical protein B6U49_09390 [Ligilactobacillus salivarius]
MKVWLVTLKKASLSHLNQMTLMILSESINLRWGAKTDSDLITTLNPGDVVKYDAFSKHDGYVWLRQVRDNGQFGYLASGECDNSGKRTSIWGKFE